MRDSEEYVLLRAAALDSLVAALREQTAHQIGSGARKRQLAL